MTKRPWFWCSTGLTYRCKVLDGAGAGRGFCAGYAAGGLGVTSTVTAESRGRRRRTGPRRRGDVAAQPA